MEVGPEHATSDTSNLVRIHGSAMTKQPSLVDIIHHELGWLVPRLLAMSLGIDEQPDWNRAILPEPRILRKTSTFEHGESCGPKGLQG